MTGPLFGHGAAVFVAGLVAGSINSVAGGGTLVSFPILVWLGHDVVVANVTNTVALWPGSLGALIGFRREIGDGRVWMRRLAAPSLAGGLVGAGLLLRTPSPTFAALVPFLILFATTLFAAQEPLMRRFRPIPHPGPGAVPSVPWWGAMIFQGLVAVYGGYFGAGIGILMLAGLGWLGLEDIHQMNALKNFFAACINAIAAVYFVAYGPVSWPDAVVMAAGTVAGGFGGAGLARRLGRTSVRRAVVVIGFGMALSLLFRH